MDHRHVSHLSSFWDAIQKAGSPNGDPGTWLERYASSQALNPEALDHIMELAFKMWPVERLRQLLPLLGKNDEALFIFAEVVTERKDQGDAESSALEALTEEFRPCIEAEKQSAKYRAGT